MENIIETITANPVYLAIAVILAMVMVFGFIKKIIKLILLTASVFILYVAYLHYTGKDTDEITRSMTKTAEAAKEAVTKTTEKIKESAVKKLEKEAEKKTAELLEKN